MQNGTTAIISRNGSHPGPVAVEEHDLLWDGLPPATKAKLGEALDEGLVSHRKGRGGRTFAYLEGRAASTRPTASSGSGAGATSSPVPSSCARARASTRRRARRATCAPTPPPFG